MRVLKRPRTEGFFESDTSSELQWLRQDPSGCSEMCRMKRPPGFGPLDHVSLSSSEHRASIGTRPFG